SVPTPGQAEIEAVGFGDTSASPELVCERWGRGTPGAAIESQLINVFGDTFQELGVADEINEIISALINQGITYLTTIGSPKGVFGSGSAKPPFSASTPSSPPPTNPLEGKLEEALTTGAQKELKAAEKISSAETAGETATGEGTTAEKSLSEEEAVAEGLPQVSLSSQYNANEQTVSLNWTSQNTSSCNASGGWSGGKQISGFETAGILKTTSYTLICSGIKEDTSASKTITVVVP
ncbi:MAG: hypothetical protein HYW09_01655, partial [Candidatus Niyogibacteria bacterium]|nr:hypothetical protein [Candidatus Niyogibacteria bacterium]